MSRNKIMIIGVVAVMIIAMGFPGASIAGVNVNVDIHVPLPPIPFPAPPHVLPIPGRSAYFVPDIDVDVLFYQGAWYRPYEGRWYRAKSYKGPWVYLVPAKIPRGLVGLPADYRRMPPGQRRIPHEELRNNWRRWDREKHWERGEGHRERGEERNDRDEGRREGRGRGHR